MNERIVAIEKYWTSVVRDTAEFQQIALALNSEFNKLLSCIHRILKDAFIADATEYGVSRWEKILELPVAPTATLEERKVAILTYLSIRRPYTMRILRHMLTAVIGEGNYTLNINNDTSTLTVKITNEKYRADVLMLLPRVLPQHLILNIE